MFLKHGAKKVSKNNLVAPTESDVFSRNLTGALPKVQRRRNVAITRPSDIVRVKPANEAAACRR